MTIKHKKILLATALVMSGISTTGCYKDFRENAAYEVNQDGYCKITGYVDGNDLIFIDIYKSEKSNSIYFCYYSGFGYGVYDVFSGVNISRGGFEYLETLQDYIIRKGYELKKQYTEEDLRNLYDEYVNEYNKNNEDDKDKSLELNID